MNALNKALLVSLLLMGTMALAVQTPVLAQQMSVTGSIAVGFGSLKQEGPPSTSSADGIGEAAVLFSGNEGPFKAQLEIGFAQDDELLSWAQHEVSWQPIDALMLTLSGSAFRLPAMDGVISVINAPAGPLGDMEVAFDNSGLGMIDLSFVSESFRAGLAVVDSCLPECGYAIDAATGAFNPDTSRMTGIVHLMGSVGDFTYRAYGASSSGKFVDGTTFIDGKGTAAGVALEYRTETFGVAVEGSQEVVTCVPEVGDVVCADDSEVTRSGMAVTFAGLGLHYYNEEDTLGPDTSKVSNVDVVYLFDYDAASIGPEYRSVTTEPANGKETTDTFVLLGISKEF